MSLAICETRPPDDRGYDAFCAEASSAVGLVNVANARLVAIVEQCLTARWWELQQTASPEHWCRVILGVSDTTARRLVRVARELGDYPQVAAAFAEGRMTVDQVEVIVTTAHPMDDGRLTDAGRWDIPRMRRIITNFGHPKPTGDVERVEPKTDDDQPDGNEPKVEPQPVDEWRAGWDGDRYRGGFDLGPELGALLEKTFGVARGDLFTARTGIDVEDDDRKVEPSTVTTVDALQRMLAAALDGLDPAIARGARPSDRTQVVLHVPLDRPESARIHLGPLLPSSVRRHLTCDADVRAIGEIKGLPVMTWERRRVVNNVLRTLVEHRDQGCRAAGCGRRGFLHVHHLWHWEDGGPTILSNLVCLCPLHHRMVHAGLLFLVGDPEQPDGLLTLDERRRPMPQPGPLPPTELPAALPFPATLWGDRLHLL